MADNAVDKLQIEVVQSTDGVSRSLDRLIARLEKMGGSGSRNFNKLSASVDRASNRAKKATSFFEKLFNSVKRIAFYRTIRTVFKDLGDAVGTGIKNLYEWDKAFGNTGFSTSLDAYASAIQNIKNSMGVALAPIVESLIPVFERLSKWVMNAANAIARFFAIVKGQSSYTKVVATSASFADNTKSANKNLKEMKRTLLGFDELNLLNDPTTSSGGAGDTSAWADAFEKVENIDFDPNKLSDRIAQGLGKIIKTIKENMPVIESTLGAFELALGAILTFSGANIPLGLGLMAVGAYHMAKSAKEDWSGLNNKVVSACQELEAIVATGLIAIGAALAFSGVGIPVGLAMIATGAVMYGHMSLNWGKMSSQVQKEISTIMYAIGLGLAAIGAVLFFTGVAAPIGVALMAAGCATFATAVKLNWGTITNKVTSALQTVGNSIRNFFEHPLQSVLDLLRKIFDRSWTLQLNKLGSPSSGGLGGGLGTYYQHYASGGSVPSGQIFMAREAGPELVGSIGTQTVVMNNDQIVSAVSDGVYRAVSAAMDGRNSNVTAHLYIDGREVKTSLNRLSRANG